MKTLKQFILYAAIGTSNVIIDFIILNILWKITNMYSGYINILFKFISFMFYSINGYYLNKKYTFKLEGAYIKYASILGIAALLNSLILSTLSLYNRFNIPQILWCNICALIASICTGIISFLINKKLIFKN
ncbi:GtrA family protein [Clostridium rectalis]|uniref:GtrA family protein n=1 Tax=Clostridium rectalis TaxID=2040295 RepID=UPI000F63134E|nr:GtrA family protein [Clostridium rectalis]